MLPQNPKPDFNRLDKVLRNQGEPDRVPFAELFADPEIMEAVIGEPVSRQILYDRGPENRRESEKQWKRVIRFWHETGYDYMTVPCGLVFALTFHTAVNTASIAKQDRAWVDEQQGVLGSWEDFENYPWPKVSDVDFSHLEFVTNNLPEGMKIIFMGPGGQMENMMWLMGMVNLAMNLEDDPELVKAVSDKVGDMLEGIWNTVADMPRLGALWLGDDMGFKSATMISPEKLRTYVFPKQKRLAEITHEHGLPFLLHSCGNLKEVMDDLIDDVGIDAKHSFEDAIQPIAEAKKQYGKRVALLGGIDVDFLCRAGEREIRERVRKTIDACAPGGGWALGSGNSIANYIPVENYLTMLDEGRKYGTY